MSRTYRYDNGHVTATQTWRGGWEYRIRRDGVTVGYVDHVGTRYYPWTGASKIHPDRKYRGTTLRHIALEIAEGGDER